MITPEKRTENAIIQFQTMIERLKTAGPGYKVDVIGMHTVDDWLTQIDIKATRARYATTTAKRRDELRDVANYCALVLSLIDETEPEPKAPGK